MAEFVVFLGVDTSLFDMQIHFRANQTREKFYSRVRLGPRMQ